jgi:hypothetical protein
LKDVDQAFDIFNIYRSRSWNWGGSSSPLPSASAFEILLDICEDVGDERRALQVTDEMKQRLLFRQKIAVATTYKGTTRLSFIGGGSSGQKLENSVQDAPQLHLLLTKAREAGYDYDFDSLPLLLRRKLEDTNPAALEKTLLAHAEKKALAAVAFEVTEPMVTVSVSMCKDCIAFYKACAKALGKRIVCNDLNGMHCFEDKS